MTAMTAVTPPRRQITLAKTPRRWGTPVAYGVAVVVIIAMLALNAIPLMASFSGTWFYSLLGAAAIYLPALFMDTNEKGKS